MFATASRPATTVGTAPADTIPDDAMPARTTSRARRGVSVLAAMALPLVGLAAPAAAAGPGVEVPGSQFHFATSNDSAPQSAAVLFGRDSDEAFVGNFDGQGGDEMAVRRGNVVHTAGGPLNPATVNTFTYGQAGDEVVFGDWDGDGSDTPAVRRGNVYSLTNATSGGTAQVSVTFGTATDEALVGDWDGDGSDSLAVRRGNVFHYQSDITRSDTLTSHTYGNADDAVVAGDWDGDGSDTVAVRRGHLTLGTNSLEPGAADFALTFGRTADGVFAGDWDADGVDTLGLLRPTPEPVAPPAPAPEPVPEPAPSDQYAVTGVWARLAQCESGGNPTTNTGNGYYGLYQFSLPTWRSVGGTGLPSNASPEEQTMRAQILQQRSGWGQWPACSRMLGLR